MAPCVLGVWLEFISVVPTTVQENATPDPKVNKQVDAGSSFFSKAVGMRRVVVERVDAHSFLRGGVVGKHGATQGAISNIHIRSMSIFVQLM